MLDNSGANNIKVLKDSWYSVWSKFIVGRDKVEVSKIKSFITEEYNVWISFVFELALINIVSRCDSLEIWSIAKCWFIKEDWNRNEASDQSDDTNIEVFSQFKASESHIWSEDLYVDIQLFSKNEFKVLIIYKYKID